MWLTASLLVCALAAEPIVCTDGSSAPRGRVRVYLLAGQSNMEGHAVVDLDDPRDYNGGRGTLARVLAEPELEARFGTLRDAAGDWTERDDVFVAYQRGSDPQNVTPRIGRLGVGFGAYSGRHHFGPELGIGHVLGERFDEPVLLVKVAFGGKSLASDFRPPSAVAQGGGAVGVCYTALVEQLDAALAPDSELWTGPLAGLEPLLDGVIWFQGWNDACDADATASYAANLAHLVTDLRIALGDATLPFIVGETGNWDGEDFRKAQSAGCERAALNSPVPSRESVRFVPTRPFLRPAEDSPNTTHGHHWYGNAASYLLIGEALGRATAELVALRETRAHDGATLSAAARAATPGARIWLAPGDYGAWRAERLVGLALAPIQVASLDPARPARFRGGVHLSQLAHVSLADIAVEGSPRNGLNLDDGGNFLEPAHHVVLRRISVRDCGGPGSGNLDGIKLSGLQDFRLEACVLERWGRGGSGIDMVGCHRGEVVGCVLRDSERDPAASGVQIKGGSSEIALRGCRFEHAGRRAVHLGGSTGLAYFRPPVDAVAPGERAEARRLLVEGCTFLGSEAPIAFVGVDGAVVRGSTFERPGKWIVRILQENTADGFVPCRNGAFEGNLVRYSASALRVPVNVGPGTAPETFLFRGNTWECIEGEGTLSDATLTR